MPVPSLADLSLGFRSAYLDHADVTRQLRAWHEAFPEVTSLTSIAKSAEGRDVWLLAIGRDPERVRPAVWVGGNIHAAELAGSSVALSIAEDVLRIHQDAADVLDPVRLSEGGDPEQRPEAAAHGARLPEVL